MSYDGIILAVLGNAVEYTALVEQLHYDIVPHGHLSHGGRSFAVLLVSCNQEGNSHRHARSLSMLVRVQLEPSRAENSAARAFGQ